MSNGFTIALFVKRLFITVAFFFLGMSTDAQEPVKFFTVKKGSVYITLSKNLPEASLQNFIEQYDLQELDLKQVLKTANTNKLTTLGWTIVKNDPVTLVISKSLEAYEGLHLPASKIEALVNREKMFDSKTNKEPVYGINRFKNKMPFALKDSMVIFFLRGYAKANHVQLAASFTNWQHNAINMQRVDSGWIATVKLPPGKHYYKFIVDDSWTVDKDNLHIENDGEGNDNSVYFKTNAFFQTTAFSSASKVFVAGSFNGWKENEISLSKTGNGWAVPVYLAEGTHTYRFIADGKWYTDAANPERYHNEYNGYNSVKFMGRPHVFFLKGYADAKRVMLKGNFNNWRNYELEMKKTNDGWELPYALGPGNHEFIFDVDGKHVNEPGNITAGGYSVLVIGANYTFRLKGYENAKRVCVAGDFNLWSPNAFAMKREGNEWVLRLHIKPGKHLYKLVVDDQWMIDPVNKLWEENEFGTGNSVLWVK